MKGQIIGKCADIQAFTGVGPCSKEEGKTVGLIITRSDAYYPMNPEEFINALEGNVLLSGNNKMWPVKNVVENTPNGGDIATADLGWAGSRPTGINTKNEAYRLEKGGECLYKQLAQFNMQDMRIFRVDDQGYIFGTVVTVGGVDYFAGFEGVPFTTKNKATGTDLYNLSMTIFYTVQNEEEEKNNHAIDVGISNIPNGVIGITLQAVGTGTARVVTSCGGVDITARYGTDWSTSHFLTEAGVNPTTVTFTEGTGLLTIAPAASYRIAAAQVLAADNIIGYGGVEDYVAITGA